MAKPNFKRFIQRLNPWNLLWPHKGKTLKSRLLKKLSIEFYETQDLSSTQGKPKLLFYDYSWDIFFLQPIAEGNCEHEVHIQKLISRDNLAHTQVEVAKSSLLYLGSWIDYIPTQDSNQIQLYFWKWIIQRPR